MSSPTVRHASPLYQHRLKLTLLPRRRRNDPTRRLPNSPIPRTPTRHQRPRSLVLHPKPHAHPPTHGLNRHPRLRPRNLGRQPRHHVLPHQRHDLGLRHLRPKTLRRPQQRLRPEQSRQRALGSGVPGALRQGWHRELCLESGQFVE